MRFFCLTLILALGFSVNSFSQRHDISIRADSVNATCGNNNGEIHIVIVDGVGPYQYSLDYGNHWQDTTSDFTGLAPGAYYPAAKDLATGYIEIIKVTLTSGCLTGNTVAKNATCDSSNGSITITAANGTAPYKYSIDGNYFQSSNVFQDLSAGNYVITITDHIGLKTTVTASIINEAGPSIKILTTNSDCDLDNGTLTVIHTDGSRPTWYTIDSIKLQVDSVFANLSPGNYKAYVKDSNGCTAQSNLVSIYNRCVRLDLEIKNSSCGDSSGAITVNVTSGVPPFQYSINGIDYQTSNIFSNLDVGSYTITVKDSDNSTATSTAEIIAILPPEISLTASPASCINNDGSISSSVKNGISPFLYSINNGTFTPDNIFRNLSIGNYIIAVKDSSGCLVSANISIPLNDNAKLFAGNDTNAVINHPLQLNAIDVNNSGFTSFAWSPSAGLDNPEIANPITTPNTNITYTVTANNDIGCKASDAITIKVYNGPEIYVPTAFTPNHDGLNDILKPIPVGIKKFSFEIYDRWGNMVFHTTDANKAWEGNIKGAQIARGTYVWFATGYDVAGNLIKRKGTVTVFP